MDFLWFRGSEGRGKSARVIAYTIKDDHLRPRFAAWPLFAGIKECVLQEMSVSFWAYLTILLVVGY